ncbi:MAG: ROK family transcriptional regulator [Anaeromyxobacteraceae bacterium]
MKPQRRSPAPAPPPPPRPYARAVLGLIWREQRISRAEIARRLELSRSTVSEIVNELLETGLVEEKGAGESRGGRRPIVLEFRDDAFGIVGVDLGAAHVSVAITDLRGKVLAWQERPQDVRGDPEGTRALVAKLVDACVARWGKPADRLVGIGVAVASPVDPHRPGELSDRVLPAWGGKLGLDGLSQRLGVPLLVDNDANLGALAERWWGAGQGVDDFAFIKVATGVGSGHIIDGKIYRGAQGLAGELGHLALDPHGPPCVCGLRGCLVTFVGAQALISRANTLLVKQPSALKGKQVTIGALVDAALAGDALARQVVREAAEQLGVAVAGMLNLMNPALVIVGGGLARLGELLLEPLRKSVNSRTLVTSLSGSRIVASALGGQDVAVGAATMVLQAALEDHRRFPVAAG